MTCATDLLCFLAIFSNTGFEKILFLPSAKGAHASNVTFSSLVSQLFLFVDGMDLVQSDLQLAFRL